MGDARRMDERLYPAKLTAAVVSTAGMIALFFVTVVRGPNEFYSYLVGAVAVALVVAVAVSVVRRRRRLRREGR